MIFCHLHAVVWALSPYTSPSLRSNSPFLIRILPDLCLLSMICIDFFNLSIRCAHWRLFYKVVNISSSLNHIVLLMVLFFGLDAFRKVSVGNVFELLIAALAILNDLSYFPRKLHIYAVWGLLFSYLVLQWQIPLLSQKIRACPIRFT